MSLMAVSEQAWAAIEANPDAPRGSFLSMLDWRDGGTARVASRTRRRCPTSTASTPRAPSCSPRAWTHPCPPSAGLRRLLERRRGHGPAAVARVQGDRVRLRDRHPRARRADGHPGPRPRARALRRPALGGPGRREPHPPRPHGRDGTPDAHGGRAGGRSAQGLRDLGATWTWGPASRPPWPRSRDRHRSSVTAQRVTTLAPFEIHRAASIVGGDRPPRRARRRRRALRRRHRAAAAA